MEKIQKVFDDFFNMVTGNFVLCRLSGGKAPVLRFSPEAAGFAGMTEDEYSQAVRHDFFNAVSVDSRAELADAFEHCLQADVPGECSCCLHNTTRGFVQVRAAVKKAGELDGKPLILVSFHETGGGLQVLADSMLHMPACVCVCRAAGGEARRVAVSPHFRKLLNMPEDEALNGSYDDLLKFVHPDDVLHLKEKFASLLESAAQSVDVFRLRGARAGSWRWVRSEKTSIRQEDGSRLIYICLTDITVQKLNEENYARFVNGLMTSDPNTLGIFRLDLTKNLCISVADVSINTLGLNNLGTADGFFKSLLDVIDGERDRYEFKDRVGRFRLLENFHNGGTSERLGFRRLASGRELRWTELYISVARSPQTDSVEAIVRVVDANDEAREKAIMQSITEDEFDFIAVVSVKNRTIRFRSVSAEAVGTAPSIMPDYEGDLLYAFSIMTTSEICQQCVKDLAFDRIISELDAHKNYTYSFSMHDSEGRQYRKLLKFNYVDDTRQEILMSRTDITKEYMQQKEQMERLQAALDEARLANKAKTEFLSRVSHDIRTPMNIIKGMTEFAFQDADDREKLFHDLDRIRTAYTFLLSLINDVLDLSRIDSGRIELHPEVYRRTDFINNITDIMSPICQQKNIIFKIHGNDEMPDVIVDKVRLNQVVLNLLTNAVKYTPSGGRVDFTYFGTISEPGQLACGFVISDTGIGMSKEFQKKMFDAFTQEDTVSPQLLSKGTGLGLSIVKKLVELLGGAITVDSEPGGGTRFTVTFNFRCVSADEAPEAADAGETAPADLSGRVLLVEDNAINAEIVKRLLDSLHLEAALAANGREALKLFEKSPAGWFSAVLMDIQMPVMNGYEATQAIRALARADAASVPIIAMTADAFAEDVQKCLAAGMNAHIAKPIDTGQLLKELSRCMQPRR